MALEPAVVTHTYPAEGTYTVTLDVAGPGGSSQATREIVVTAEGVAPIIDAIEALPDAAGTPPCSIQLKATVTGTAPFTYLWQTSDGQTSSEAEPTFDFDWQDEGIVHVTLMVSNAAGEFEATKDLHIGSEVMPFAPLWWLSNQYGLKKPNGQPATQGGDPVQWWENRGTLGSRVVQAGGNKQPLYRTGFPKGPQFDGDNDVMSTGNPTLLNHMNGTGKPFTIAALLNDYIANVTQDPTAIAIFDSNNARSGISVSTSGVLVGQDRDNAGAGNNVVGTVPLVVGNGLPIFACGTRDGASNWNLYTDEGVSAGSGNSGANGARTFSAFDVGGASLQGTQGRYIQTRILQVAVWDRVLTAAEVAEVEQFMRRETAKQLTA